MESSRRGKAELIKAGSIKAFESLFRSHYSPLVGYSRKITGDKESAEEVVQDLFYRLWRDRDRISIESTVTGYLYRSVYNRSVRVISHRMIKERYAKNMEARGAESPDPHQELIGSELGEIVVQTLENLPERCSEIFCLNRFEGLKYRDIAKRLSISIKTVEANMGRALKELRKVVGDYYQSSEQTNRL